MMMTSTTTSSSPSSLMQDNSDKKNDEIIMRQDSNNSTIAVMNEKKTDEDHSSPSPLTTETKSILSSVDKEALIKKKRKYNRGVYGSIFNNDRISSSKKSQPIVSTIEGKTPVSTSCKEKMNDTTKFHEQQDKQNSFFIEKDDTEDTNSNKSFNENRCNIYDKIRVEKSSILREDNDSESFNGEATTTMMDNTDNDENDSVLLHDTNTVDATSTSVVEEKEGDGPKRIESNPNKDELGGDTKIITMPPEKGHQNLSQNETTSTTTITLEKATIPATEEANHKENAGNEDDEELTTTTTTKSSLEEGPNEQDILSKVDELFHQVDTNKVTVTDIVRKIEKDFQIAKLEKKLKKIVRHELIKKMAKTKKEESTEEEENSSSSSSEEVVDDNEDDKTRAHDNNTNIKSRTRSSTLKGKSKKKPSHLKIHHEQLRKRQIEERKIRMEELYAEQRETVTEKDRLRAESIAKKFDTDSDFARVKRIENRLCLLDQLEKKRSLLLEDDINNDKADDTLKTEVNDNNITVQSLNLAEQSEPNMMSSRHEDNIKYNDKSDEIDREEGDEDGDSDEDEDLEILGVVTGNFAMNKQNKEGTTTNKLNSSPKKNNKSPRSIFDYFGVNCPTPNASIKKKKVTNTRIALRNSLRVKQFENGNKWLARELGYENTEDHVRDCETMEKKKKEHLLQKEAERNVIIQKRKENLKNIIATGGDNVKLENAEEPSFASNDNGDDNENSDEIIRLGRTVVGEDELTASNEREEEDEELALAREIEKEQKQNEVKEYHIDSRDNIDEKEGDNQNDDENLIHDCSVGKNGKSNLIENEENTGKHKNEGDSVCCNIGDKIKDTVPALDTSENSTDDVTKEAVLTLDTKSNLKDSVTTSTPTNIEEEIEFNDDSEPSGKDIGDEKDDDTNAVVERRPKNAAWKALLKKEKEIVKKQKANRKNGGLVDAEAEEEEDEEGVVGLEDFGFTVKSKDKADDDDDQNDMAAEEEEMDAIVDEVSDNEGDEEAGEAARKTLAAQEEKLRHKEIMRRMREGYDGRRGGIAGSLGGGARGNHRFDQLVAADNKDDARRLGLLNDDEFDSDDENARGDGDGAGDGEIEDETILLDKVLKDRFLNKPQVAAENFSDEDENSENEEDANDAEKNEADEEEHRQDRIAKRFSKRARMNRLLEVHNDEGEFSQSRLMDDDDEGLRKELKSIKNLNSTRMRQISGSSSISSNSRGWGSCSNTPSTSLLAPPVTRDKSDEKSLLMNTSGIISLGLILNKNKSRKRKSSFLGGVESNSSSIRSKKSLNGKGLNLGHVLFNQVIEKKETMIKKKARTSTNSFNNSNSYALPSYKSNSFSSSQRKGSKGLWSKISTNSFRKG